MTSAKRLNFKVGQGQANQRLDVLLSSRLSDYSRQFIAKQIKAGRVMIDGRVVTKPKFIVKTRQQVQATLESLVFLLAAEAMPLDIIYQDENMVVVNKPAGLVMHPAGRHRRGTLANALKARFKEFYLVHRLDKDTSGVVVVALKETVKQFLSRLFEQRKIHKYYIALLKGHITPIRAHLNLPIGRGRSSKFEVMSGGRSAESFYQVKRYIKRRFSLVKVEPKSGRTHQIRVHFKALGHPVVGDTIYGVAEPGLSRQFLHAQEVKFRDWDGRIRKFTAPLPQDLIEFLRHAEA